MRWGALYLRGPQLLRDEAGRWCTIPVELKFLLEDFIELTPTTQGPYEGRDPHPVFELYDLSADERTRLEFIGNSGLDHFLFGVETPGEKRTPPRFEAILRLGFDEKQNLALIQTLSDNEAYVSELSRSSEGTWSLDRTITYDQWTKEWDETPKRPGLFDSPE